MGGGWWRRGRGPLSALQLRPPARLPDTCHRQLARWPSRSTARSLRSGGIRDDLYRRVIRSQEKREVGLGGRARGRRAARCAGHGGRQGRGLRVEIREGSGKGRALGDATLWPAPAGRGSLVSQLENGTWRSRLVAGKVSRGCIPRVGLGPLGAAGDTAALPRGPRALRVPSAARKPAPAVGDFRVAGRSRQGRGRVCSVARAQRSLRTGAVTTAEKQTGKSSLIL